MNRIRILINKFNTLLFIHPIITYRLFNSLQTNQLFFSLIQISSSKIKFPQRRISIRSSNKLTHLIFVRIDFFPS